MVLPVQRQYSGTIGATNVFFNLTDNESNQDTFTNLTANALIDFVNAPDPDSGLLETRLTKNGQETPVRAFSNSVSPNSSGRVAIGPVNMSAGNYIWKSVARTVPTVDTVYSIVAKYSKPLS